ncbi:hypothetical protein COCSADRAFT_188923 [Bipolaris sorokiniana ND90Pr]|uniref:Uncharacterized protein n=1 Tax=Cochliobolus sativus (strain ND90Pr / ATCC 201652) TaxID=665912 RepID=M2TBT6_COCSN|nr:uncharacterized protein COCSADRAFT_188923 [Bipolaris sorokiniana ND90Pr]EMD66621.1 hypothetical protein COCSADRAFT_188923 [Bipolaris sorokiniana ND90Pr]
MSAVIALGIYILVKVDELQDVEGKTSIAPTSPPICPVTPSSPRPDPLIPAIYPPPYEFPFEHFRGTGESFVPSRQNFHVKRPRYIHPVIYKGSAFLETVEDVRRPDEGVSVVAEDAEPTGTIKADLAGTQEYTLSPPYRNNRLPSLPETVSTQTPLQIPRLPKPPSPTTLRVNALNRVAQEEYKIQEQMVIFLNTIPTGSGYELSASLILDFLCEAKKYLEPLFPGELSGITKGYLVWGKSIIDFWDTLSPYGWDFVHYPDSRFGLEELLKEFLFVPPFIPEPEPIHEPFLEPFLEPVMTTAEAKPQFQEQMRVAQVFSFAAPPPPLQPEHSAPQLDSAPATYTYTMSAVPMNFSYRKSSQRSYPPPPPQQEQHAPLSFKYILPSNPVNPSYRRSNRTSKPPLPRSSRPSQPLKNQVAEPPNLTPVDPNLIDFKDPKWSNKSTPELTALPWSSFSFPSPSAAALKIWSYSTMSRLVLPEPRTKDLPSEYIKSHLETVALEFKHATAVLRLQALDCDKPCEDDLGMSPLFGEVMSLMVQAADFTERCDELCVWYARDSWYHDCFFVRCGGWG